MNFSIFTKQVSKEESEELLVAINLTTFKVYY